MGGRVASLSGVGRSFAWFGRRRPSPEVQALGATLLCAVAIVTAGWMVWVDFQPDPEDADGEPTLVVAESQDGRLLMEMRALALGSRTVTSDAESFRWSELTPAVGMLDTGVGRVQLGAGVVSDDGLTEARFVFGSAGYLVDGVRHELSVPQDTLRLRVPGEPGAPGDRLLVVFDAVQSLREADGILLFEPFVSEARWLRAADEGEASSSVSEAGDGGGASRPSSYLSGSSSDGGSAGDNGGGGGGGGGTGGDGGSGDDGPGDGSTSGDVGNLVVFVRDVAEQDVRTLTATFNRVALDRPDAAAPHTFYDGARSIDLRALDGPDDRAELVSAQAAAGRVDALRLEFAGANADILTMNHDLVVPQPILVIEAPFMIEAGKTTEVLVDFSIEESLVMGAEGWEFRPVAFQFQTSLVDTDGDGTHDVADPDDDNDGTPDNKDADRNGDGKPDVKPAQYRTGGSSLPTLAPDTGTNTPAPVDDAVEELDEEESRPIGSEGTVPDVPVDADDVQDKLVKDVKLVGWVWWMVPFAAGCPRFRS